MSAAPLPPSFEPVRAASNAGSTPPPRLARFEMPPWARAVLLVAVLVLLWHLASVLLLVFSAIVLAVTLRMLARQLGRLLPMPDGAALALVAVLLVVVVGGGLYLFGDTVRSQVGELTQRLPQAWQGLKQRIDQWGIAPQVREWIGGNTAAGNVATQRGNAATSLVGLLTDALLVLVGAVYFAAQSGVYRRGFIALVPPQHQVRAGRALNGVGESLENWLKGQVVAMLTVGLLTGIGAALIGLPSAFALGLLAALLEFVPIVGPIISAVPALLPAATLGWSEVLWTLALFIVGQQVEGNLLMPAIMQKALELPPAVTLFAVLAFGLLFGPLGVLLATPLTVVIMVLVQQLYLSDD
jgi:predicted PurR-regulated permease PerM